MNPLTQKIKDLEIDLANAEDEPTWIEEYKECLEDIKIFCSDCPLSQVTECHGCSLHKHKEEEVE
jgi:hypothetical protein